MNYTQVNKDYIIRYKYYNGRTKSGRIKWSRSKFTTAFKLSKLIGVDKTAFYFSKIKDKGSYTFIKKEFLLIQIYLR